MCAQARRRGKRQADTLGRRISEFVERLAVSPLEQVDATIATVSRASFS